MKTWLVLLLCFSLYADKPDIYWKITKAPYLDEVKPKKYIYYDDRYKPLNLPFNNNNQVEPWHWGIFYTLQALDIYSTSRGIKYNCIYELNPLLPKKPTDKDLIVFKTSMFSLINQLPLYKLDDKHLLPSTMLVAYVVHNNFQVEKKAKAKGCKKIL